MAKQKEPKGTIITRRIELYIVEDDPERRKEQWKKLRDIEYAVFLAANTVTNEQYFNRIADQRYVSNDGTVRHLSGEIRKALKNKKKGQNDIEELKAQQKDAQAQARATYNPKQYKLTSGPTYDLLSHRFTEINTSILNGLNAVVDKNLKNEWKAVEGGERSLRTYRRGIPIPWSDSKESDRRDRYFIENSEIFLRWLHGITFRLHFGKDKSGNRAIIDQVLSGSYGLSDSSIQIKDNKIFLLLCVRMPQEKHERNKELSLGVDLGIVFPAYWALSEGFARGSVGSRKDLFDWRVRTDARRRQLQQTLVSAKGGHGRKRKLKALDRFRELERNYVHTYNHTISKQILDAANKYNVGTIKLEFLKGFGKDENGKPEKKFVLRNWSFFELQKMIEDKAKRSGIEVLYVDPYHTSQTCALCTSKGERIEQAKFVCKNNECKNFDKIVNADYNASLNIARKTKFVSRMEECEIWKRRHDETEDAAEPVADSAVSS